MSNTTPSVFAPVLIPTLCRFEHLKRLLESLERNRYATETDVYVALDYPLKESHWPGYKKILEYIDGREFNFKSFNVIKRERNYGFGENGNLMTLLRQVSQSYDRYIFTEDDNEFAPGFLEYMNLNLERYKDDPHTLYVCGYLSISQHIESDYTQYRNHIFSAWGYGSWFKKREFMNDRKRLLETILANPVFRHPRTVYDKEHYLSIVSMSKGSPWLGDGVISAYMKCNDMKSVFPTLSMVRNHGWDGSGTHGGCIEAYSHQEINESDSYQIVEAPDDFGMEIERRQFAIWNNRFRFRDKAIISIAYGLYRYLGVYVDVPAIKKRIKRILKR